MAHDQGLVERVARGLYRVPGGMTSEHVSLAEACKRASAGVVRLISALSFHELTMQIPHFVYLALPEKAHAPRIETVEVRFFRFSGDALSQGIETHDVESVEVRISCPAKTVADCFKYRNKTGLDVAIEALRDCLRQRKATVDDLVRYGRICRVERVMRPCMEAMLGYAAVAARWTRRWALPQGAGIASARRGRSGQERTRRRPMDARRSLALRAAGLVAPVRTAHSGRRVR